MDLISHPFRVGADGVVATVVADTEDAHVEAVAILASTRKGERDLVPDFGLSDPAFDAVDVAELNLGLADFGPDVTVVAATVSARDAVETVDLSLDWADDTDTDEDDF